MSIFETQAAVGHKSNIILKKS